MNKNRLNFPEIQDTHLDQMIRLAFEQETALWAQQLIAESEKPLTSEQQEHADRMLVRMMVQIDQEERTVRRRNKIARMKRMVPRLIEVAACIVLIIGIAAPFAIANVESIRSAVMKMLIRIDWEKGEMQMNLVEDDSAAFDVPAQWPGEYFPSYLPQGFEMTWKSYAGGNLCIEYTSESGMQVISFSEMDAKTTQVSGIEGAIVSYIDINGHEAVMIETEHPENEADYFIGITWDHEEKWFSVNTSGISKEKTIQIAQSVKKIIKR